MNNYEYSMYMAEWLEFILQLLQRKEQLFDSITRGCGNRTSK